MSPKNMCKKIIGVIGEHPNNDAEAIIALLQKYVIEENWVLQPCPLKIRGAQLDSLNLFAKSIQTEKEEENYERFIVVRDLDVERKEKDKVKIKNREKWFKNISQILFHESFFFIIIYELETLILCDLDTANSYFGSKITISGLPIKINNPKEFLTSQTRNATKRYDTSHAKILCAKLDFYKLYENHQGTHSFKTFVDELKNANIIGF
jgi:hypothetical protein